MATKKSAKKTMSKKSMKKTKGGFDVFISGVENPTMPASQLQAGKFNLGGAQGCATGQH